MLDVDAYLTRIGYRGQVAADLTTLNGIHRAHMRVVPFENLDIMAGRPIVLDEARLFDKLVRRRRGGFCYEQNGLFAAMLRAIGFEVSLLSARVATAEGGWGIPFDHLTLAVHLDELWLADVGFGDSFQEPLRLVEHGDQIRGGVTYRVTLGGDERVLWQAGHTQYTFALAPRASLADFESGSHYHQTSPLSSFTRSLVCSLAAPDGRVTLSGRRLIVTAGGQRTERELSSETEVSDVLWTQFGIAG
ncbi:MAG: arylamine N-acetyltransferase [Chloroflexi bacterium]|nr:arylamine N-acetyltransferase [Chloroflexota bacterium]